MKLDKYQLDFVNNGGKRNKTVLIAGAGAGKTECIAQFVKKRLDNPEDFLIITFTNKSGENLKKRTGIQGNNVGTFHSFILNKLYKDNNFFEFTKKILGINENFVISNNTNVDSLNDVVYLKAVLGIYGITDTKFFLNNFYEAINNYKLLANLERFNKGKSKTKKNELEKKYLGIYEKLSNELTKLNFEGLDYVYLLLYLYLFDLNKNNLIGFVKSFNIDKIENYVEYFKERNLELHLMLEQFYNIIVDFKNSENETKRLFAELLLQYFIKQNPNIEYKGLLYLINNDYKLFNQNRFDVNINNLIQKIKLNSIENGILTVDIKRKIETFIEKDGNKFIENFSKGYYNIKIIGTKKIKDVKINSKDTNFINLLKGIYKYSIEKQKENNLITFDDLLYVYNKYLETNKEYYKYVIIDEAQDNNKLQYDIVNKLLNYGSKVILVGDDLQSIYGFRYSSVKSFIEWGKDADIFYLKNNYRSNRTIVELGNELSKYISYKYEKNIEAFNKEESEIRYIRHISAEKEAEFVLKEISSKIINNKGITNLNEICILSRNARGLRQINDLLLINGIPLENLNENSFFERPHIKYIVKLFEIVNGLESKINKQLLKETYANSYEIGDITMGKIFDHYKNKSYIDISNDSMELFLKSFNIDKKELKIYGINYKKVKYFQGEKKKNKKNPHPLFGHNYQGLFIAEEEIAENKDGIFDFDIEELKKNKHLNENFFEKLIVYQTLLDIYNGKKLVSIDSNFFIIFKSLLDSLIDISWVNKELKERGLNLNNKNRVKSFLMFFIGILILNKLNKSPVVYKQLFKFAYITNKEMLPEGYDNLNIVYRIIDNDPDKLDNGDKEYIEQSKLRDVLIVLSNRIEYILEKNEKEINYINFILNSIINENIGNTEEDNEVRHLWIEDNLVKGKVKLMSVHKSKGLEFDEVYLLGVKQGNFPSTRFNYANQNLLDEEYRLLYVGITRAKKKLVLNYYMYERLLSDGIYGSFIDLKNKNLYDGNELKLGLLEEKLKNFEYIDNLGVKDKEGNILEIKDDLKLVGDFHTKDKLCLFKTYTKCYGYIGILEFFNRYIIYNNDILKLKNTKSVGNKLFVLLKKVFGNKCYILNNFIISYLIQIENKLKNNVYHQNKFNYLTSFINKKDYEEILFNNFFLDLNLLSIKLFNRTIKFKEKGNWLDRLRDSLLYYYGNDDYLDRTIDILSNGNDLKETIFRLTECSFYDMRGLFN